MSIVPDPSPLLYHAAESNPCLILTHESDVRIPVSLDVHSAAHREWSENETVSIRGCGLRFEPSYSFTYRPRQVTTVIKNSDSRVATRSGRVSSMIPEPSL